MKLFTSNYAKSSNDPMAVSISQGVPKFFHGKKYPALAPSWKIVKNPNLTVEQYKIEYQKILDTLDVHDVVRQLGDGAVMLCWESANEFCHRQVVAKWMNEAGYDVEEKETSYVKELDLPKSTLSLDELSERLKEKLPQKSVSNQIGLF